jgi:hypothetical protein
MPRYMIEASHDPQPKACARLLNSLLQGGAHILSNVDFGCEEGVHTAWIIVEAENDHYARLMVPPVIRDTALLVKLNKYTPDQIKEMHRQIEAG